MQFTKKIYTSITAINTDLTVCKFWDFNCNNPNAERKYYLTVTQNTPHTNPFVIVLYKDEQINALLIGRKIWEGPKASITIIYGGLLGIYDQNRETVYSILKHLTKSHRQVNIRYVNLNNLLFPLLQKRIPLFQRNYPLILQKHWILDLPASYEEFISKQKRKHRYWQRRIKAKLFEAFKDEITMSIITTSEDIDKTVKEIELISKKTYHWKIGAGFKNNSLNRERLICTAQQGGMRIFMMHIKGIPVAFWQCTQFRGTLYLGSTGYIPEYERYEIGSILFHFMIEHCINDTAIMKVDFGFGDASYKERYGTSSFDEVNFFLNAANPFPVLKNVEIYLMTILKPLIFKVISKSKIKKYLRASEQTGTNVA